MLPEINSELEQARSVFIYFITNEPIKKDVQFSVERDNNAYS
jgi:hypothetical protein